jgi:hypothetical protein
LSILSTIGTFVGNLHKTLNTRLSALELGSVQRVRDVSGSTAATVSDAGVCLNITTGNTNSVVALPIAGIQSGYAVHIRKSDTGSGEVRINNGVNRVMTLFQVNDFTTLVWSGSAWLVFNAPDTEVRTNVAVDGANRLDLNGIANGIYKHHSIELQPFTTAATENRTLHLFNTRVGESYDFFVSRNATAGTKTVNFSGTGVTYRKTWNGASQAVGTNQFWQFSAKVVSTSSIWVVATRHY